MTVSETYLSEPGDPLALADPLQSIPLAVLKLSLLEPVKARTDFPDYRLTRLVTARLDMEDGDIAALTVLTGCVLPQPPVSIAREFELQLRTVIERYGLSSLFQDDGPGRFHHAIRPSGYDYQADEVDALGMEHWRAFYRGMSPERQMLAASILWLYRGRKDNRWLRRVPCTWHASDAIQRLNSSGLLSDWGQLIALYPGW